MLKFPKTPEVAVAEKEAKNVVEKKEEDTAEEINPIKAVEKKEVTGKKEARKSRAFIS